MNFEPPQPHKEGGARSSTMAMFGCFLFVTVVLALDVRAATENRYKNVLFFAVDDLRPELGAYGSSIVKSPNLDALASKSMVFERAYCQIAVCSPSRTSLLTGRRPDTNHVWEISKMSTGEITPMQQASLNISRTVMSALEWEKYSI